MGVAQKVSELATAGGLCLVVGPANAKWEAKAMRRVADELRAGLRQASGLTRNRAVVLRADVGSWVGARTIVFGNT